MPPFPEPLQQTDRTYVLYRGRRYIYFGGCDYFRLASHPKVLAAAESGLRKYGLNVSASRRTTGNHILYDQLEEALCDFFGIDAALLVSNGYATGQTAAQGLKGLFSRAFVDGKAHGCIADAATALGCPVASFDHANVAALKRMISNRKPAKPALVLTDGAFAYDGSIAPLREYRRQLPHGTHFLIDDAHGAGVLGMNGRGTLEELGLSHKNTIRCLTLSKAFGVYGGAVLGERKNIDRIRETSRMVSGNTPLPLPLAAAALKSIRLLKAHPEWRDRLVTRTRLVKAALRNAGYAQADTSVPILAIHPGSSSKTDRLRKDLLRLGIFPSHIHYAGGPAEGYFRFALSSEHTTEQLRQLLRALRAD